MSQTLVDYRVHLATRISNKLILEHSINTSSGLSEFLELDSRLNNQQAIRYWVKDQIEEGLDVTQEPYTQLERILMEISPINDE
jgi:hypothetical protein